MPIALVDLLAIMKRRKWLFIAVMLFSFGISYGLKVKSAPFTHHLELGIILKDKQDVLVTDTSLYFLEKYYFNQLLRDPTAYQALSSKVGKPLDPQQINLKVAPFVDPHPKGDQLRKGGYALVLQVRSRSKDEAEALVDLVSAMLKKELLEINKNSGLNMSMTKGKEPITVLDLKDIKKESKVVAFLLSILIGWTLLLVLESKHEHD